MDPSFAPPSVRAWPASIFPSSLLLSSSGPTPAPARITGRKETVGKALKDDKVFTQATSMTRPPRFPVTRFEVPVRKPAETPLIVVLDDCDQDFEEGRLHHDALRILSKTDSGVRTSLLKEFNTAQTVGAVHNVAVDAARGQIYFCEHGSQRITAVDLRGRKLWQVAPVPRVPWQSTLQRGTFGVAWARTSPTAKRSSSTQPVVWSRAFPSEGSTSPMIPRPMASGWLVMGLPS